MPQENPTAVTTRESYWKRLVVGVLVAEFLVFIYFQHDVNRHSDFYFPRCGDGMEAAACTAYLYALFHWDLFANLAALYRRDVFEGLLMTLLSAVCTLPFVIWPRVLTWLFFFLFFMAACFMRVME